jgi:hypothetical protein
LDEVEYAQFFRELYAMSTKSKSNEAHGIITNTKVFVLGSIYVEDKKLYLMHQPRELMSNVGVFRAFVMKYACPNIDFRQAFNNSKAGLRKRVDDLLGEVQSLRHENKTLKEDIEHCDK